MPDKYDEQIERLNKLEGEEFRSEITQEWATGFGLFALAQRAGDSVPDYTKEDFGCLTMIRQNLYWIACTPELTERIRNDTRIPDDLDLIEKEHLPIFAEYQREIDAIPRPIQ